MIPSWSNTSSLTPYISSAFRPTPSPNRPSRRIDSNSRSSGAPHPPPPGVRTLTTAPGGSCRLVFWGRCLWPPPAVAPSAPPATP